MEQEISAENHTYKYSISQIVVLLDHPASEPLTFSKNNIPYYTLDVYRTASSNVVLPAAQNNNGSIPISPKTTVSASPQLASIPDALIIFPRPITYKISEPDFLLHRPCKHKVQQFRLNFSKCRSFQNLSNEQEPWCVRYT
jgi:hypothetical protein